jgi:hypothetical protein
LRLTNLLLGLMQLESRAMSRSRTLWTQFDDFAAQLKQRGAKSSQRVPMAEGSNKRETVILLEMQWHTTSPKAKFVQIAKTAIRFPGLDFEPHSDEPAIAAETPRPEIES